MCAVRLDVVHSAMGASAARAVLTQTGNVALLSNVGMVDVRGIEHVQSCSSVMHGAYCVI